MGFPLSSVSCSYLHTRIGRAHLLKMCVLSATPSEIETGYTISIFNKRPVPESDIKEVEPNSSVKPLFSSKIE